MDPIIILQAGVATGTVLLFATIGEIFAERAGVLNLGVEGMMLMGAMSAYSVATRTGNGWIGLLAAMLVAGLISQLHAVIVIHLQADQVVSGLALAAGSACTRFAVFEAGRISTRDPKYVVVPQRERMAAREAEQGRPAGNG